ncbi:MAG: hypothetical protein AUG49_05755 [Catenulispora sp. 13_1_20CM_3_70_7]|nr:MAG: hypothetical protein AUG49_05755 [Catenulispora sp. 13_1_20CM_3_70_7]
MADPQDSFVSAVRTLVAAFIGLVLSSLGYAVLAGEPSDAQARSASSEPVLGVGFAVTGSLIIYAIALTLDAAEHLVQTPSRTHGQVSASVRHILAWFVAPLLVFYIFLSDQDYEDARYGQCHGTEPLDYVGLGFIAMQVVVSWLIYPIMIRRHTRAKKWNIAVRTTAWVSWLLLLVTFASAIAFALIGAEVRATHTVSPLIPGACIAIMTLAMVGLTGQLAYTHQVPHAQDQPHVDRGDTDPDHAAGAGSEALP